MTSRLFRRLADPHQISETKVLTTIVGGRVVYQSDAK